MQLDERRQHGDDEYLVRQRVDELSEVRDDVALARDVAVHGVRYRRDDEDDGGDAVSDVQPHYVTELSAQR